jgi:acetyl esterase/lipase
MPQITYPASDGHLLKAELFLPVLASEHKNPMVIVIHGGGWRSRSGRMTSICKKITGQGFLALNITYRLAPCYHYPVQQSDVREALRWVQQHHSQYNIDTERIFVWGYSAGAQLAFNLANEKDSGIKAVVAGGMPSYFPAWPGSGLIRDLMGVSYEKNKKLWELASPLSHVSENSPPVFLYHGQRDLIVGFSQTEMMVKKLKQKKVRYALYKSVWMGHIAAYIFDTSIVREALNFLKSF